MKGAILHAESDTNLKLILELAEKLGISIKELNPQELEEYGLAEAISKGRTGEYLDTESFLNELRDEGKD